MAQLKLVGNLIGETNKISFYVTDKTLQNLFSFEVDAESWVQHPTLPGNASTAARTTTAGQYKVGTAGLSLSENDLGETFSNWISTESQGDISAYTGISSGTPVKGVLGLWLKVPTMINITSFIFEIGSSSSNYASFTWSTVASKPTDNTWYYVAFDMTQATITGTPDWTAVDYFKFGVIHGTFQEGPFYLDDVNIFNVKNFKGNLMSGKASKSINQVETMEARLVGITSAADKALISRNNPYFIFAGKSLFHKGIIEQPQYNRDYTVDLKGYQSTGSIGTRRLLRETVGETNYTATACSTILSAIAVENTVTEILSTTNGGATPISIKFNNENRMTAIDKLADASDQDWWFEYTNKNGDYGYDDASNVVLTTSMFDGDVLCMSSRRGTAGTQMSFYITGSSANCRLTTYNYDISTSCNDAIILNSTLTPLSTEIFEATTCCSTLNKSLDTYLAADIDDNDMTIYATQNQNVTQMPATDDFRIKIDSEAINITSYSGTTMTVLTGGRATDSTTAAFHKAGTEILNWRDTTSGTGSRIDIDVDDNTIDMFNTLGTNKIRIGSEVFSVTGVNTTTDTFTDCARGQNDSAGSATTAYSHLDDILVYLYSTDGVTYSIPTTPEGTSAIGTDGIHKKSFVAKDAVYRNDLDRIGQAIVIDRKTGMKRTTLIPADLYAVLDTNTVEIGDDITITDDVTGLASTATVFKVIGMNLILSPFPQLEMEISNTKYIYTEELTSSTALDYVKPAREVASKLSSLAYISTLGEQVIDGGNINLKLTSSRNVQMTTTNRCDISADNLYLDGNDEFYLRTNSNPGTATFRFYDKNTTDTIARFAITDNTTISCQLGLGAYASTGDLPGAGVTDGALAVVNVSGVYKLYIYNGSDWVVVGGQS